MATILGDDNNNTLTGTDQADTIIGFGGTDVLKGLGGDDTLKGGTESDTLDGGEGSDTYLVGPNHGFDVYSDTGKSGVDRIVAIDDDTAIRFKSSFGQSNGIEEISANGFPGATIVGSDQADNLNFSHVILTGITLIDGGYGNDTITGSAGADFISAGPGDDALDGGDGSDTYIAMFGGGHDKYSDTGATGTDRIIADSDSRIIGLRGFGPSSGIEEISANGHAGVSIRGTEGNDTLDFSHTILTGIVLIDGGAGNDIIKGTNGADFITGGGGRDWLDGGEGSDTYYGGSFDYTGTFATYPDSGLTGTDRIVATGDASVIGLKSGFGTASGIEEISADGHQGVQIIGDVTNDSFDFSHTILTGIQSINGGAGNDVIIGSSGDDTISGGTGADTLNGGEGSDTYQVGFADGFDTYADSGTTGTDRIVALDSTIGLKSGFGPASGIEQIDGGSSHAAIKAGDLADVLDFSNTILTNVSVIDGGAGKDTITGSHGDDVIHGGAGNDILDGGEGSDTYLVGPGDGFDSVTDTGGGGADRIVATEDDTAIGLKSGFKPASGIEEMSADFHAGVSIQGDSTSDTFDFSETVMTGVTKIDGGAGNDKITGSAGADVIVGGDGDDTITGGSGADVVTGGAGADRFIYKTGDISPGETITDFHHADGDKINLTAIDAVDGSGNNFFTFIGQSAFSGVAGQLHYVVESGGVAVQGDTNGDGIADFSIHVLGVASLVATDFAL